MFTIMDEKERGLPVLPSDTNTALPQQPRENLIGTAVKFLLNPKVRESPFAQRRVFLEKKGLTNEEIDIAIARSGTAGDEHAPLPVAQTSQVAPLPVPQVIQPAPVSAWMKFRDYLATAIVIGGASYGLYYLYKKYLAPYLYGPSKEDKKMADIQKSIDDLSQVVADTLKNLQETQKLLLQNQGNLQDAVKNTGLRQGADGLDESKGVGQIKEEIKSLKGLLLNRKQFPATPMAAPVIPSWQLTSTNTEPSTSLTPSAIPASSATSSTTDASVVTMATSEFSMVTDSDGENTVSPDVVEDTTNELKAETLPAVEESQENTAAEPFTNEKSLPNGDLALDDITMETASDHVTESTSLCTAGRTQNEAELVNTGQIENQS